MLGGRASPMSDSSYFEPSAVRCAYRRFWRRCAVAGTIGWVLLWWPGFLVREQWLLCRAADFWGRGSVGLSEAAATGVGLVALSGAAWRSLVAALRELRVGSLPRSFWIRFLWWFAVVGVPAFVLGLAAVGMAYFAFSPHFVIGFGIGPAGGPVIVVELLVFLIAAAAASAAGWLAFWFSLADLDYALGPPSDSEAR